MNNDEYLRLMKQAIDESVKENEKVQQYLVWLHEKTASLGSPYQESALRAFYCDIVEGTTSINREISRMLDSNLDKDIEEVRGIAIQLDRLLENRFFSRARHENFFYEHYSEEGKRLIKQVGIIPAIDIVIDRHLAIVHKQAGIKNPISENNYLPIAVTLLVRQSDRGFRNEIKCFLDNCFMFRNYHYKRIENEKRRLNSLLVEYRNLNLDWQFSEEEKQCLNNYYTANKLLVDCLLGSNASLEVQKEIQETLLLPIVEIERRKSSINKKLLLDCLQESNVFSKVKGTQEMLLPKVEIEKRNSNEVQQSVQKTLPLLTKPLPTDEIAQHKRENKQSQSKFLVKTNFYTTTLFYSSLLIALILYIVFITVLLSFNGYHIHWTGKKPLQVIALPIT